MNCGDNFRRVRLPSVESSQNQLRFGGRTDSLANAKESIGGHLRQTSFLRTEEVTHPDPRSRGTERSRKHTVVIQHCESIVCIYPVGCNFDTRIACSCVSLPLFREVVLRSFSFLFFPSPACSNDVGLRTPHNQPLPEGRDSPCPSSNTTSTCPWHQVFVLGRARSVTAPCCPGDVRQQLRPCANDPEVPVHHASTPLR
jgi:hypothetical protein